MSPGGGVVVPPALSAPNGSIILEAFHTFPAWLIWIISGFPSDSFNLFPFVRPLIAFYLARDCCAPPRASPRALCAAKYVYRALNFLYIYGARSNVKNKAHRPAPPPVGITLY
ncbi:hypothetical protein EVAR_22107_1 [Eumeta japonica]|uniref:Uncharacterized protein n=1 Tax=Eumeta variegata TaxID=151549 RepID=A0A4C1VZI9_EUMVA|nr:hypothetical protein EVAR_22107_1 [Eumeta japonica]